MRRKEKGVVTIRILIDSQELPIQRGQDVLCLASHSTPNVADTCRITRARLDPSRSLGKSQEWCSHIGAKEPLLTACRHARSGGGEGENALDDSEWETKEA